MKLFFSVTLGVFTLMIFLSCRKPYFQYEQPPFVLKQYYEGKGVGGNANWWWNVYISGKQLQLPDNQTDFREIDLGLSKDPPCLVVKSDLNIYLIRIIQSEPHIMLIPDTMRGPYGWSNDGLEYVTKNGRVDIRTGKILSLPKFPGDFLGFSPDNRFIISSEFKTPNIHLYQTDFNTGDSKHTEFPLDGYRWLNDWTHFKKPVYAPNVWIFGNIRWNKKDIGGYDMIVPKDSEISGNRDQ